MTMVTNAQNTFAQIGIREELADTVYMIDPQDTPFLTNVSKKMTGTNSTLVEWQTQGLTAPAGNYQLEGDVIAARALKQRARIGNRLAISYKAYAVSGTGRAINVAGVPDELNEQRLLAGLELKRDQEIVLLDNVAQATGGTTTVRKSAGFPTYVTNTDAGMSAYSTGDGLGTQVWAYTTSSARALSLSILNTANYNAWKAGGRPNILMLSGDKKIDFSALALTATSGAVQLRYNINSKTDSSLIGAVEFWQSDFGGLNVIPNVMMDLGSAFMQSAAYIVDNRYLDVVFLREMVTEQLGRTGDADQEYVLSEYTLKVGAPKGHAIVANLS